MHITFSPVRSNDTLELERLGNALIINGETFDFSPLPDGASLPNEAVDCVWLHPDIPGTWQITREGGTLHLTIKLPCGPSAPPETRFPDPVTVTSDGLIAVPPHNATEEGEE